MKEISLKIASIVDNYLPPDGVIHGWRESQRIKLNQEIFSLIEQSNQDRWISVEERLPEKDRSNFSELVITIDQHNNIRLLRYDFEFSAWNTKFYAGEKVSHWQPLPTAPKTK